jgi:hypothetical protein
MIRLDHPANRNSSYFYSRRRDCLEKGCPGRSLPVHDMNCESARTVDPFLDVIILFWVFGSRLSS